MGIINLLKSAKSKQFIFIHINKTGGMSIEHALNIEKQHLTALELKQVTRKKLWEKAFKFSIVRNPWDRVVSHYFHRVRTNQTGLGDNHLDFGTWVEFCYKNQHPDYHDKPKFFMPQLNWLTDENGHILVDFIGRFENLEQDFQKICKKIGISKSLPLVNKSNHWHYQKYYNAVTREIVRKWFEKDIDFFDYQFEESNSWHKPVKKVTNLKPTKVFGIGFHKTGTKSLAAALEHLGYRVCGPNPELLPSILNDDMDAVFDVVKSYDAFQDNPWPLLYKKLDEKFPGSKFILTTRDVDEWMKSVNQYFGTKTAEMRKWIYGVGSPAGNHRIYKKVYEDHIAQVKNYFKNRPGDLLVINVKDGNNWEKLCEFLNKDVPKIPFPYLNRTKY